MIIGKPVGISTGASGADTVHIVVAAGCRQNRVIILVTTVTGHSLHTVLGAGCGLHIGGIGVAQCGDQLISDYSFADVAGHNLVTVSNAGCGIDNRGSICMLAAGGTRLSGIAGLAGSRVIGICSTADSTCTVGEVVGNLGNLNALQNLLANSTDLTGQTSGGAGCGSRLNLSLVCSQRQILLELITAGCAVEVFAACHGTGGIDMLDMCIFMLAQRIAGATDGALLGTLILMGCFNNSLALFCTASSALLEG